MLIREIVGLENGKQNHSAVRLWWQICAVDDFPGPQLDEFRGRNQSLLIGGEACLWTEYADDDSIMARLWLVLCTSHFLFVRQC